MADAAETQMFADPNLRRTGILPLGPLPWGSHVCIFYESPEDLIEAHCDYFGAGLADNERCVWAVSEPLDRDRAIAGLREAIVGFDDYMAAGAIELIAGDQWYVHDCALDRERIAEAWLAKLEDALGQGFAGLRASGNAFWLQTDLWETLLEYEADLDRVLAGTQIVALCSYPLGAARATDLLDVAKVHHIAVTRRGGKWESLESTQLADARREISLLNNAIDVLSRPFPGHELLTPRERAVLGQIVKGASNKESARALAISPRTIEFHRTNIRRKLKVRNAIELVGMVLGTG